MQTLVARWRRLPTELAPGLSDREFDDIEAAYSIRFPLDLRHCLQATLPIGPGFPEWRSGTQTTRRWDGSLASTPLRDVLAWPLEGILFDVEHNNLWRSDFGQRAETADARRAVVTNYFTSVPRLVPIFGHRYMPQDPHEPGNPVFSVYQSDVVFYGLDLADYLAREFEPQLPSPIPHTPPRQIRFWSSLAEGRD